MSDIEQIKKLREETSVSVSECKNALSEAGGDFEKAKEILRKMGKDLAGKRIDREAKAGLIHSYVHPNKKIGVMLEIRCESDFVASSEDFKNLAHEICLQIAAMSPLYVKEENVPKEALDEEKGIYKDQLKDSGKPEDIIEGIIEGKIKKYKKKISLFSQTWIKDESKTIKDLVDECFAKVGENIIVKRFVRYEA